MSRNLCRTDCRQCSGVVRLLEAPRYVTKHDTGRTYFEEMCGMLVADAACQWCGARYLAWVTYPPPSPGAHRDGDFVDLSYRSTFNDEPGEDDLPSPSTRVVSSARLARVGAHDEVTLFNRGALAGTLRLAAGDGAALLERLGVESTEEGD